MTSGQTIALLLFIFFLSLGGVVIGSRLLRVIRTGRREEGRFAGPLQRLGWLLAYGVGQKRVAAKKFGFNHLIIFYGFLLLLVANAEYVAGIFVPGFDLSFLPTPLHHALLFMADVAAFATLLAVILGLLRRTFFPPYEGGRTVETYVILAMVGLHMVAALMLTATGIGLGRLTAEPLPISTLLAQTILHGAELPTLATLSTIFWWLHGASLLIFFAVLIPFTKHLHVIAGFANCFMRSPRTVPLLQREEFAVDKPLGADHVGKLTWKDLFDPFACTQCGQCQLACPATVTGKPLNPRLVVAEVKKNLLTNSHPPLVGEGRGEVSEDAIWSCTTCGACVASCPVFIEQFPKLIKFRRYLVQMEAKFPQELITLFENMEGRSNPWGLAPAERGKWATTLGDREFDPERCEILLYVGCAGSFDARSRHVTVALITLLDAAGVRWGILGKDELCCGDSLRRLGNEYLFDVMARKNVELFKQRGVRRIVTTCPHCFSTFDNDYRQYGLELEVTHHSRFLQELLSQGRLTIPGTAREAGKVVYHDPCYLGRHNGIYDEPRAIIAAATGDKPAEVKRSRQESFCCGAGGGRMWMEEQLGSRINLERVDELLRQNPDTVCVSCPYCMTMVEDGLKDRRAGETKVKDLAELLAEACRPQG
ncbi:MAG TPA: heterodisulfide reductase-related iron-sulfur binding cluster [Geobacterales bacterium]|nr:heterodisulfide reductase-related iron-sulfur binding cluster [Geobacterales bacterium]